MKIYKEVPINEFKFWGGAGDNVKHLFYSEIVTIESILEELYPDGMTETQLNDIFWFKRDRIAEWLGYPDFETMID